MASSTVYKTPTPVGLSSGAGHHSTTDLDETPRQVCTSARVTLIKADNTGNIGAACWVKLYNVAVGSVTVGTTVPWAIFKVRAGERLVIAFKNGLPTQSNISVACVTTGGSGGTTGPATAVPATIHFAT